MTAEQRNDRLCEIKEQRIKLREEEAKLCLENDLDTQQTCLKWVGRAFKGSNGSTFLITSVPPLVYNHGHGYCFNEYLYPCIIIPSKMSESPLFDGTVIINQEDYETKEITFIEFQSLLHERIDYLLKRAATAKMRQTGNEVFSIGKYGEICEK